MIEPQNRLQDRENFKVELTACIKCKRKDRLVNSKVGQAFCNLCRGLKLDIGTEALRTLSKLTEAEIHTMNEEEIKEYEYRIKGKYMDNLMHGK